MDNFAQAVRKIEHHAYSYEELRHLVLLCSNLQSKVLYSSKQKNIRLRFVNYGTLPKTLKLSNFLPGKFNAAFILLKLHGHGQDTYHWALLFRQGGTGKPIFFDSLGLSGHELFRYLGDNRLVDFLGHNKIQITKRNAIQQ